MAIFNSYVKLPEGNQLNQLILSVFEHGSLVPWHLRYLCLGTHQWTPVERMYTGGNRVVDFLGMGWRRNSDLHNDQDRDPKATRLKFLKLWTFLLQMHWIRTGGRESSIFWQAIHCQCQRLGDFHFAVDDVWLLWISCMLCFVFALLPFLLLFLVVPWHTVEGFCLLIEPLLQRLALSSLRCLRHTLLALAEMIRMHIFSMSTWQMASRRAMALMV